MNLKESLKVLQALNALPRKDAKEVVKAWMDQMKDKPTIAAKNCTPQKRKVFNRQRFTPDELKFIRDCLASGLSQAGTAREAKIKFNRRSIGAYELRVSGIAKELRGDN